MGAAPALLVAVDLLIFESPVALEFYSIYVALKSQMHLSHTLLNDAEGKTFEGANLYNTS